METRRGHRGRGHTRRGAQGEWTYKERSTGGVDIQGRGHMGRGHTKKETQGEGTYKEGDTRKDYRRREAREIESRGQNLSP